MSGLVRTKREITTTFDFTTQKGGSPFVYKRYDDAVLISNHIDVGNTKRIAQLWLNKSQSVKIMEELAKELGYILTQQETIDADTE